GLELKLARVDQKLEARYRGPNVTPGYFRQAEATQAAFDEEGFYRTGDALRFVDSREPNRGMLFDGRIAEDFKLSTGTWVSAGPVRAAVVEACAPLVADAVLTGIDRDCVGAILFPALSECQRLPHQPPKRPPPPRSSHTPSYARASRRRSRRARRAPRAARARCCAPCSRRSRHRPTRGKSRTRDRSISGRSSMGAPPWSSPFTRRHRARAFSSSSKGATNESPWASRYRHGWRIRPRRRDGAGAGRGRRTRADPRRQRRAVRSDGHRDGGARLSLRRIRRRVGRARARAGTRSPRARAHPGELRGDWRCLAHRRSRRAHAARAVRTYDPRQPDRHVQHDAARGRRAQHAP